MYSFARSISKIKFSRRSRAIEILRLGDGHDRRVFRPRDKPRSEFIYGAARKRDYSPPCNGTYAHVTQSRNSHRAYERARRENAKPKRVIVFA